MGLREFKAFRALIHERTGIWLRDGKQVMLASRLSRRLRHHGMSDFAEYYQYVQKIPDSSEEIYELINCVTTNKTSFFRERHHFDFLRNKVVPEAREALLRGAPRTIRIWSAASSTGEEAYTIAITLLEALQKSPQSLGRFSLAQHAASHARLPGSVVSSDSWKIEVVASDIDTKVLETARRAIYPTDALSTVAPPLQKNIFSAVKTK